MKALKIIGISLLSVLVIFYLAFLFVLPNVVNLNNYKDDINKAVKDASGLVFNASDIKLKTTWDLKAKLALDNVSIKYSNNSSLLAAKHSEAGIKLLPLLLLNVQLSDFSFENPELSIAIGADGRYDIEKYLNNLFKKQAETPAEQQEAPQELPVKISNKMPDIILKNYNINLKDTRNGDLLKINGPQFKIYGFELGKRIKIATDGKMTVNGKQHAAYSAKIESFLPKTEANQTAAEPIVIPEITFNPIKPLKKYNFGTELNTDIKISQNKDNIELKGYLNAEKINYKLKGQNINGSFLKLTFKGNDIDINSNLFVNKSDKFVLKGLFKNGKRQYIDLGVISDKINLADIQSVLVALTDVAGIKTDIDQLNITGSLDSNFNVKSDMKKIQSSGGLKISNASISHSSIPLKINNIKSNLDFSNNKIKINDTSALINGSLFKVSGVVDDKANADVLVTADNLPLNLLYEAFAPVETKKTLKLTNGTLSMNILAKGRLDKIEPKINVNVAGLNVKETSMGAGLSTDGIIVDLIADTKGQYNGTAKANNFNLKLDNPKAALKMPKGQLDFDTKDITIKPSVIYLDNSNAAVSGIIKNYASKLDAKILANGKFTAADALKYLPKEYRSMVSAKGVLPIIAEINSDGKNTKVQAQALANAQNNLTVLNISSLNGKTSVANLSLDFDGSSLKIQDLGLYGLYNSRTLTDNFKTNLSDSFKVVTVDGSVDNITSKVQTLNNIKINTPNTLTASIPGLKNSSVTAKANIAVSGTTLAPVIKGSVVVPSISAPDYKFTGKNIDVVFNKEAINAKSSSIDLNGSKLAFDTSISTAFGKYTTINNLSINSEYIDVDKLLQIMEAMPQTNVAPSASIPVIIQKGHGSLAKVKMGTLCATNASGDFTLKNNIFKLNNLKATAYNGTIAGNVQYNIPYETAKAALQGRGLDSNGAVTAFTGLKDQMTGKLDFDTDLSLIGMTWEQQMKTLKGYCNFSIADGQMGSLGRLEHFIYASNLISQKFSQSNLNSVIQTLAPKNTGKFNYLKGKLTFSNGWASFDPIHSGGPQMSLYITGRFNILNNYADLEILGRVAREIVSVMGPVGDMSVSKLVGNIPKLGSSASNILNSYNAVKDAATLNKVPQLVPQSSDTKQFQVVISGNIEKPSSVRTFKWLASEAEVKAAKAQIATQVQNLIPKQVTKYLNLPSSSGTGTTQTSTGTSTVPSQSAAQSASDALKETAKNAASQAIQKALPNFWNKIE